MWQTDKHTDTQIHKYTHTHLMKPADMKLSMASAGTLLSFPFHWSSGTYSTWSSTNYTHDGTQTPWATCVHLDSSSPVKSSIPSTYLATDRSSVPWISDGLTRQLHHLWCLLGLSAGGPSFFFPDRWRRRLLSNNLLWANTVSCPVHFVLWECQQWLLWCWGWQPQWREGDDHISELNTLLHYTFMH